MKNILILILVTLGIMNYNQATTPITSNDTSNTTLSGMEIQQFNEKFTQYEGDSVRGATVKSMLQTVLANNMSAEDESRKVSVDGDITLDKDDTQLPEGLVTTGKTYKIICKYEVIGDRADLVTLITVEENQ